MANSIASALIRPPVVSPTMSDAADLKADMKARALNRTADDVNAAPKPQMGSYAAALKEAYDGDTEEAMAAAAKRGVGKSDGVGEQDINSPVFSEATAPPSGKSGENSDSSSEDKPSDDVQPLQGAAAVKATEAADFKSKTHTSLKRDHQKMMERSGVMEKFELSSMVNGPAFKKLAVILASDNWQKDDVSDVELNRRVSNIAVKRSADSAA